MALSANKVRYKRAVSRLVKGSGVGADSSTFYEGALVCFNTTGKIAVAADTAGFRIAGICTKYVVTGSSNTVEIEFERGHEEWIAGSGATAADLMANVCVADDGAYTDNASTNDVEIGALVELETKAGTAGGWVRIGELGPDAA